MVALPRTLRRTLVIAALVLPTWAAAPAAAQAQPAESAAARLLDLANAERQAAGLPSLTARGDVTSIAAGWSVEMAEAGAISHNDSFFSSATKSSLGAKSRGENVGVAGDADDVHGRFMDSAAHRANILNPRFTVVGFGAARGADGQLYVTEAFIEPAGAAAPAPAAPAPAPVARTTATVATRAATPTAAPRPAPAPAPAPAAAPAPAPEPAPEAAPAPDGAVDPASVATGPTAAAAGGRPALALPPDWAIAVAVLMLAGVVIAGTRPVLRQLV